MPPIPGGAKACAICHQKKVKCDLADGNNPCTNCSLSGQECRPHQRKRKSYAWSSRAQDDEQGDRSRLRQSRDHIAEELGVSPTTEPALQGAPGQDDIQRAIATQLETSPTIAAAPSTSSHHAKADETQIPTTARNSFVGYDEYLGGQVPAAEENGGLQRDQVNRQTEVAEPDLHFLRLRKALDLPSRPTRESLVDAFMDRCHPWMPIVERRWLEDGQGERQPSMLLLQAVFLAGSRVTSSPLTYTSSQEFYERARALFFHGHETNTTLAIVAVCLLQWWNPTGPDKFSTNTSGLWVRIGTELAYQVGLHREPPPGPFRSFRRRLWWTLVTRDSIISVGTGRPRTINIDDCNISLPTLEDFPEPNSRAHLFVAYVSISRQMGDIAEAQRRKAIQKDTHCRQHLENSLFRWLKDLPPCLQTVHKREDSETSAPIWTMRPYDLEARQLIIPYFVSLILLNRSSSSPAHVPTVSLMAASYIVAILEEFLSRDHLRYLGPAFAFYALAAGLVQTMGLRHDSLQDIASHDFNVIQVALSELGKRWGTAQGALRALTRARHTVQQRPSSSELPPPLGAHQGSFFFDFGPDLCSIWYLGFPQQGARNGGSEVGQTKTTPGPVPEASAPPLITGDSGNQEVTTYSADFEPERFTDPPLFNLEEVGMFNDPLAEPDIEGMWLFNDFDMQSIL